MVPQSVIAELRDVVGPERVNVDPPTLAYFGTDISGESEIRPALAVRPDSVDDLCRVVATLTEAGVPVIARGAGYSYTRGYVPARKGSAVIDVTSLNRIVEINEADRYVTVEAGCTWSAMYEALKAKGLRTPYFGPLSGRESTVGGAASNNASFFGSGLYGTMADNVLSLDVVLANGDLVETGAAAAEGRTPFLRHFGPDLTGVFLGDCGAFGIKARVTMPLIAFPAVEGYLAFAFERFEDIAEAHVALARENIAAEQWGIDPEGNENLAARGFKFLEGITFARDVAAASQGAGKKVLNVVKMLVDGHRAVLRGGFSLHVVVEGESQKQVDLLMDRARRILVPMALKELPNTVAQVTRAKPFRRIKQLLSPAGENWLPLHGIFPLSRATEIVAVTEEYFVRHRETLARHGIKVSYLSSASARAFTLEPMFFWNDRLHAFHLRHVEEDQRRTHGARPPDPAAREAVQVLRRDLALLWDTFGASHMQMGKFYAYADALSSASLAMVKGIKAALDPKGLMNPGALQLGEDTQAKIRAKYAEFPQNLLDDR